MDQEVLVSCCGGLCSHPPNATHKAHDLLSSLQSPQNPFFLGLVLSMPVYPQGLSGIFQPSKDQAAVGSERSGTGQQGWLLWGFRLIRGVQPDLSLGSLVSEKCGTTWVLTCIMCLLKMPKLWHFPRGHHHSRVAANWEICGTLSLLHLETCRADVLTCSEQV